MTDIRTQLPECPLEYEVPAIPGTHTALVIAVNTADIDWQEKMLPWTLASLINNTDIVMKGVHIYIACEDGTEDRIQTAISNFDFPDHLDPIFDKDSNEISVLGYNTVYFFDINYWAFRDPSNTHKLSPSFFLKDNLKAEPYPNPSNLPPDPMLYDMKSSTIPQFRHAMKQLLGAQLAMEI